VKGIYDFDGDVFGKFGGIEQFARGELEVTDLLECRIKENRLAYAYLDGRWIDAGVFDSLLEAAPLIAFTKRMQQWRHPNYLDGLGMQCRFGRGLRKND